MRNRLARAENPSLKKVRVYGRMLSGVWFAIVRRHGRIDHHFTDPDVCFAPWIASAAMMNRCLSINIVPQWCFDLSEYETMPRFGGYPQVRLCRS
jgi:hypothetical protein